MARAPAPSSGKLVNVPDEGGWSVVRRKRDIGSVASKHDESSWATPNSTGETRAKGLEQLHERLTIPQANQLWESIKSRDGEKAVNPFPMFQSKRPSFQASELESRFKQVEKDWLTSDARSITKNLIGFLIDSNALQPINVAICLGLGSLSCDNYTSSKNSMAQLVVYMDICRLLSEGFDDRKINLIAQDPALNLVDAAFLSTLGIVVTPSPSAFSKVDENTFVFAPHYSVSWWSQQMRAGYPSLIIGNDVEKAIARVPSENELLQIFHRAAGIESIDGIADGHVRKELRQFQDSHESRSFPVFEPHEQAFIDTRAYWFAETQ